MNSSKWPLVICWIFAFSGCDLGDSDSSRAPEAAAPAAISSTTPKNCLFIILDAASALHMKPWGYRRETTPFLDDSATRGVRFMQARSQGASTIVSVLSYFSGQYPPQPAPEHPKYAPRDYMYTMADAFTEAGFRTGGFSENPYVWGLYNFDKGFETFEFVSPFLNESKGIRHDAHATEKTIQHAREWIEERNENERWFCYLHLLRPHNPYHPPEPFDRMYTGEPYRPEIAPHSEKSIAMRYLRKQIEPTPEEIEYITGLYDGNLAYVDSLLAEFVGWLDSTGRSENTLVVIASDHGEAFNEHGHLGHGRNVHEELIRVPLIFYGPGADSAPGTEVDANVELLDLYPTFAELFSLTPRDPLHGISLAPLLRGPAARDRYSFSQSLPPEQFAVLRGDQKVIGTVDDSFSGFTPTGFYDLRADPWETKNLLTERSDTIEFERQMKRYLDTYLVPQSGEVPLHIVDTTNEEELRALGYID